MSSKFKIGDKVKVVSSEHPHRFTKPYNFLGKVGTILDYRGCDLYKVNLGGNIGDWILYESELELVKDETFPDDWYVEGGEEFGCILRELEKLGYDINVSGGFEKFTYSPQPQFSIESKDLRMCYYGYFTPRCATKITPEQFKQYVLSQNKEEKEMNKTQKISREGLGELYNNVCANWQSKIMSIISTDKFANEFEVDKNLIKQAYKEANETQIYLLDKYFTKPKKKVTKNLERWVNVFADGHISGHHLTKENAIADIDRYQVKRNIIATVKLVGTYETEE